MSISWSETRNRLECDRRRLLEYFDKERMGRPLILLLNPSYLCIFLHRISHYFFTRSNRIFARFFWHLNLLLTGADISPVSDIGGGFVVGYPLGVVIIGKIGKNFTMYGHGGIGGGRGNHDIGAGPGLPILGDGVELGFGAFVLGAVHIGDRVYVGSRCYVARDVPSDATIEMRESSVRVKSEVSTDAP